MLFKVIINFSKKQNPVSRNWTMFFFQKNLICEASPISLRGENLIKIKEGERAVFKLTLSLKVFRR